MIVSMVVAAMRLCSLGDKGLMVFEMCCLGLWWVDEI
jgi:hypothetical protein